MESTADHRQSLTEAERAAAAVYVDYPALPGWYPLLTGLWSAALVAALALLQDHPFAFLVRVLALVGIDLWFIVWYRARRGTMPSLRHASPEIRREMLLSCLGCALVVTVVAVALQTLPAAVSIVLALVLVTIGVSVYERRYARASEAVRARLA